MSILNPTPLDRMTDSRGRPYFLWDSEMSLAEFRAGLGHEDPEVRAYLLGKLMRQAKPDDVFDFTTVAAIRSQWPRIRKYLGRTAAFWSWIFETWEAQSRVHR